MTDRNDWLIGKITRQHYIERVEMEQRPVEGVPNVHVVCGCGIPLSLHEYSDHIAFETLGVVGGKGMPIVVTEESLAEAFGGLLNQRPRLDYSDERRAHAHSIVAVIRDGKDPGPKR